MEAYPTGMNRWSETTPDAPDIPDRTVTDRDAVLNRRTFVKAGAAIGLCGPVVGAQETQPEEPLHRRAPRLIPPFVRPDVFPAARAMMS